MAALAIIWRNPNCPHRLRRWSQVRRDNNRTLYLVLESVSTKDNTWEGLPTLEVIRRTKPGAAAPKKASIIQKFLSGA